MDINSIRSSAVTVAQTSTGITPASTPAADATQAAAVPAAAATVTPPSIAQVKAAVDHINASLSANGSADNVQFAVDPSSKKVVVQMLDPQTGKVIRQVPSEEIIQISMTLGQKLGQVLNQQA